MHRDCTWKGGLTNDAEAEAEADGAADDALDWHTGRGRSSRSTGMLSLPACLTVRRCGKRRVPRDWQPN